MCLAVPGKICAIKGDIAIVDYDIEKREGKLMEESYCVGDYVIIQGGVVVQKIEEREAKQALRLYKKSMSSQDLE